MLASLPSGRAQSLGLRVVGRNERPNSSLAPLNEPLCLSERTVLGAERTERTDPIPARRTASDVQPMPVSRPVLPIPHPQHDVGGFRPELEPSTRPCPSMPQTIRSRATQPCCPRPSNEPSTCWLRPLVVERRHASRPKGQFAMQKVESSSLFIRSRNPSVTGLFLFQMPHCPEHRVRFVSADPTRGPRVRSGTCDAASPAERRR